MGIYKNIMSRWHSMNSCKELYYNTEKIERCKILRKINPDHVCNYCKKKENDDKSNNI